MSRGDIQEHRPATSRSLEDVVLLQSTVAELRRERDALMRRLHTAEAATAEKAQLSESRLRQALAQVDALKRNAQAVRSRLEAETRAASARAEAAHTTAQHSSATVDELQTANADLTTLVEITQSRLADLETESQIYHAELLRLQEERSGDADRLAALSAETTRLRDQLAERAQAAIFATTQYRALEATLGVVHEQHTAVEASVAALTADRNRLQSTIDNTQDQIHTLTEALSGVQQACSERERQLSDAHAAYADELAAWQDAAAQREAGLVIARDRLARRLEEEQSTVVLLRQQVDSITAKLCTVESRALAGDRETLRLEQETAAAHQERERERVVYEAAAQQREEEFRQAIDALRQAHAAEIQQHHTQQAELRAQLEALQSTDGALQNELAAAAATQETLWCQLQAVSAKLDSARTTAETAQAQSVTQDVLLAERSNQCVRLAEQVATLAEQVHERDVTLEHLQVTAQGARERDDSLQAAIVALEQAGNEARAAAEISAATIDNLRSEAGILQARLTSLEAATSEEAERLATTAAQLQERDARIAELMADAEAVRHRTTVDLDAAIAMAREREEELLGHQAELTRALDAARHEQAAWESHRQQLQQELAAARTEAAQQQTALLEATQTCAASAGQVTAQTAQLATLEARIEAAEATAEQYRLARDDAERRAADACRELAQGHEQSIAIREAHAAEARQLALLSDERSQLSACVEQLSAAVRSLEAERDSLQHELRVRAEAQDDAATVSADIERERDELRQQIEQLSTDIRQAGHEHEEQRKDAQQTQQGLTARIDELTDERQTLHLRLNELGTLSAQLEHECERLRRDRIPSDEARRLKTDIARLEAKLEEMERQRSEAAHHHSAAVAGYMVELNQRSEALHLREIELQRANEELAVTRQACEEAVARLTSERQEHADVGRQLDELRKAAAAGTVRPVADSAKPSTPAPTPPAIAPKTVVPPRPDRAARTLSVAGAPIAVIHIDENKEIRDCLRQVVGQLPEARYLNTLDVEKGKAAAVQILAVNLLNRAHDPLAAIGAAVAAAADRHSIFAYCAEGSFGFTLGEAQFFTPPLDPDACVAWLLESRGSAQRLLAASNDVEMTSNLRTVLTRIRCSTSVALDLRQVMDLVPMIQPEVVMVDLSLPRAEGLRLVSRLRSDPKTRDLPLGILLPETAKIAEFRQHAVRAARESPITPEQLAEAFNHHLGVLTGNAEDAKPPSVAQAS